MKYFVVKYSGPFGFIKPWTAVRDSETFSQQFLTPSIVAGMERKLFPSLLSKPFGIYKIVRHRLSYEQMTPQQEQIQSRGWNKKRVNKKTYAMRNSSILVRSVLLNPTLFLAFNHIEDAQQAFGQHICLCRNEDILFPSEIFEIDQEDFEKDEERFAGYELIFEESDKAFLVGYNRLNDGLPMYGWLKVLGNPISTFS